MHLHPNPVAACEDGAIDLTQPLEEAQRLEPTPLPRGQMDHRFANQEAFAVE